eukprot:COSAG01_NODE_938_length_12628_cov_8.320137_6_plen_54_part_00
MDAVEQRDVELVRVKVGRTTAAAGRLLLGHSRALPSWSPEATPAPFTESWLSL